MAGDMNAKAAPSLATPVRIIHDPSYERAINACISAAEDLANEAIGYPNISNQAFAGQWTREFHTAMDKLTAERGLRKASWQA